MKKIMAIVLLSLTMSSGAEAKTKIKVIKKWVKETGKELTCGDEYLKRRRQLGIKIGLSPVIIAGSTAVGVYGGAFAGAGIFALSGSSSVGFADLAAVVGGGLLGGVTGLSISSISEGIAVVNFLRNQDLLRLIYESRTENDEAVDKFFVNFKEMYPDNNLSQEEFSQKIAALDEFGKLCDGSIVDPKRYKRGKKLKQRLATKKEIFKYLAR